MDPRLRTAIDATVCWYADLFAVHGVRSTLDAGLLVCHDDAPPLHSTVVVAEPWVTVDQVARAVEGREPCGVADCFASLDLSAQGLRVLFEATWVHRPAGGEESGRLPAGWRKVADPAELARWNAGYDSTGALLPSLLDRPQFSILAKVDGSAVTAGVVARLGTGAVHVSNVHAVGDHSLDWGEVVAAVQYAFPGRAMAGYERGTDLLGALAVGFDLVGEHRVWVR